MTPEERMDKIERTLRRAVALGVRELRAERRRRAAAIAEIDDKITKLASAQLVTEELLQRFLKGHGTNGGGHAE